MILDLSLLNLKIKYRKFKMNTIFDVLKMTRKDMYLCSIDIREAYFHLPIFSAHKPYLRFCFGERLMEFQALPNGLSSGPKMFTEITKAIMNHLRKLSILISIYLDDTYLCAQTKEELLENITITLDVL